MDVIRINEEFTKQRKQAESVDTPKAQYRCVFRTRHGYHYTYHHSLEDAQNHEHNSISAWGEIQSSNKQKIEKRITASKWKKISP